MLKQTKWIIQNINRILHHKLYVLQAGLKLNKIINKSKLESDKQFRLSLRRLLRHDLSKFSLSELPQYSRQFFSKNDEDKDGFEFAEAWIHHQNHNSHHWEYWVARTKHQANTIEDLIIPMPSVDAAEMVVDWLAAGRAYKGEWPDIMHWDWLHSHIDKMSLHKNTLILLHFILSEFLEIPYDRLPARLQRICAIYQLRQRKKDGIKLQW